MANLILETGFFYNCCNHFFNYSFSKFLIFLLLNQFCWLQHIIHLNIHLYQQADTLNYLGFTTRKLGDFEAGEKYYLLGLQVDPKHVGINEYLGELYVVTNRIDLAKERLEILKSCNCEEYQELKEIIEGTKKSKY